MDKYLQISLVFLLTLSASALCLGQEGFVYPFLVLGASLLGFALVDRLRWFQLNRFWLNFLTLLAAVYSLYEIFFYGLPFEQVVGAANLLVNIELILLFRRKTVHLYWQLILLSFLQVVVGAAFRQPLGFGILLCLYLVALLLSCSLLVFWRERQLIAGTERGLTFYPQISESKKPFSQRLLMFLGSVLKDENLFFRLRPLNVLEPQERPVTRFPLGRTWRRRMISLSVFSLIVCLVFFLAMPRFGEGAFLGFRPGRLPRIGFSNTIRLGELGPLKGNPQPVCRVRLWEAQSEVVYPKSNQLYLRGLALNVYDNKTWTFENARNRNPYGYNPLPDPFSYDSYLNNNPNWVRCEYEMLPSQRAETFLVSPFFSLTPKIKEDYSYLEKELKLCRKNHVRTMESVLQLGTFAIQKGVQVEITPVMTPQTIPPLLNVPENEQGKPVVPTAATLAQKWLDDVNLSVEKDGYFKCAKQLERMLRDSGQYQYSLSNPVRKRYLDPVEDFLSENKVGHCEYFAAALVLLLRNAGIPSEIVVGYFCDEYNAFGNYFQVRQSHAHAWVEVWLPPEELGKLAGAKAGNVPVAGNAPVAENGSVVEGTNDDWVIAGSLETYRDAWPQEQWSLGAWLRLDPTPDSAKEQAEVSSMLDQAGKLLDWVNLLWKNYVVELNAPRQKSALYTPVWEATWKKIDRSLGLSKWRTTLYKFWHAARRYLGPGSILLFLFSVGALRWSYRRWKLRRVPPLKSEKRPVWTEAQLSTISFYRQLELRLKSWGFVRRSSQTPRQFIRQVEQNCLQAQTEKIPLDQIVDQYYQVRFGQSDKAQP